ncbi:MAG: ABC transporter ATP-binding protein [Lachnospiraceae bacterium]|nr:ABC transporter ATP-binding protein [Lachnospiraceae bacterium]
MELSFEKVSGTGKKAFLQKISFTVKEGYITGLIGANGAGKTTLFHTVMDENAKYEGVIRIDGQDIKECRETIMNRIGFISEEQQFFMDKTAGENVKLYAGVYDVFKEEVFSKFMHRMGLSPGKTVGKMSRGEYLKFQVAFAMAHDSKLFLLDEVTAGMDPVFKKEFFKILHEIVQDETVAVLMSTHIKEEVDMHMDYVARLECGHLVSFKEASEEAE